jgi:hypothetical protein
VIYKFSEQKNSSFPQADESHTSSRLQNLNKMPLATSTTSAKADVFSTRH